MASLIFNSFLDDIFRGNIDCESDNFKVMLVTSAYSPNKDTHKDTHTKRSDINSEVVGSGYSAGGVAASVAVTKDVVNDRIDTSLGAVSWIVATITARGAIYYKSRGGLASSDELVAYIDFGSDIVSTNGTFSLSESTLRIQN